jgi:hypothetical protein
MFIRKILHVLQDSDLSIYGLRDMDYAKVWKKRKKISGHLKVQKKDTWRSQGIERKNEWW